MFLINLYYLLKVENPCVLFNHTLLTLFVDPWFALRCAAQFTSLGTNIRSNPRKAHIRYPPTRSSEKDNDYRTLFGGILGRFRQEHTRTPDLQLGFSNVRSSLFGNQVSNMLGAIHTCPCMHASTVVAFETCSEFQPSVSILHY